MSLLFDPSDDLLKYNSIRLEYFKLAENLANNFLQYDYPSFKNMDTVHTKCNERVFNKLNQAVDTAIRSLIAADINDVDDNTFINQYMLPYYNWDENFSYIDDQYLAIVMQSNDLDEYRTQRRLNRSKWVGGGFGIEGALTGAAKAGAMNGVTNLMHGTWNLGAKFVNNVGNEIKKQNLYESNETKAHLFNSIFELLFSVHNAYIDVLNKYKPNSISCLNEVSIKKSESLFDNIRKNRIDNSQLKEKLLDVLTINPYYTEAYLYYYNKYNDTDGVLEKTALFFGIDIVSEKKIAELKRQIELNTTKMDVNEKINFANNYSKKIGLQKNINLSNSLVVQDKQQRTFNGVLYNTTDEAHQASQRKELGWLLGIGIVLMPYIFSFFTLNKRYPSSARIVGFSYLLIVALRWACD